MPRSEGYTDCALAASCFNRERPGTKFTQDIAARSLLRAGLRLRRRRTQSWPSIRPWGGHQSYRRDSSGRTVGDQISRQPASSTGDATHRRYSS